MRTIIKGICIAVMLAAISWQAADAATTKEKFDALCTDILESIQAYYPVQSTRMGIHSYDHRLTDFSSKSVKNHVKKFKDFEVKLHKFQKSSLSAHDRVNYRLAKANLDMALLNLDKIKWHRTSPLLYVDDAVDGVYYLMASRHAPLSEKLFSLIERMKAVPVLLQTARKNLSKPPPAYIEAANDRLESGIDFFQQVASELMNKFPDRADEILRVSTRAREAMNDFLMYLSEIKPGEEKDFAIGKQNLDYMLSNGMFLPYTSDSLLALGEQLLAEASQAYDEYEEYVDNQHQNGLDSIFVPKSFTRQDVLDYYDWEIEQVKLFLSLNEMVIVPDDIAPLTIDETPAYLRSMISSIAYMPAGPFDRQQDGYFYVRPIPDDPDRRQLEARFRYVHRRGFRGAVVREAFPGRHLQMQYAARSEDPVRRWQMNAMMIEGWTLHCEELMYRGGLYGNEDPATWLNILGSIRSHAARLVADVKLHTGQFTFDECVAWMSEAVGAESESARQFVARDVLRFTHAPIAPLSPLIGKLEIDRLRDAAEEKDGLDFSEKDFYERLLTEGTISPFLIWEAFGLSQN